MSNYIFFCTVVFFLLSDYFLDKQCRGYTYTWNGWQYVQSDTCDICQSCQWAAVQQYGTNRTEHTRMYWIPQANKEVMTVVGMWFFNMQLFVRLQHDKMLMPLLSSFVPSTDLFVLLALLLSTVAVGCFVVIVQYYQMLHTFAKQINML